MANENLRVFHAHDLDRTLIDTGKMVEVVDDVLKRRYPMLLAAIRQVDSDYMKPGKSFPLIDTVADLLGEKEMERFTTHFQGSVDRNELLLPGALERLEHAKSRPEWSSGILTAGRPAGQLWKMQQVGLDSEPHLIVDSSRKGKLIASWVIDPARQQIQVPAEFGGGIYDTLIIDDDKDVAFDDLPEFCYGNWVWKEGSTRETPLPPHTVQVPDLYAAIDRTDQLFSK